MSNHRLCGVHAFIFSNSLELQQYLNFFFSLSSGLWLVSPCNDSLCTGPVANQSLSFCLAVMHTNSQQHILISPEFKAHQSQLTGPPGPTRAILKKCFILCLSDTCESELMTLHLVSATFYGSYNIFDPSKVKFELKIKQKCSQTFLISSPPSVPLLPRSMFLFFGGRW